MPALPSPDHQPPLLHLPPGWRRIVQALLYEVVAVTAVGPGLGLVFGAPMASSLLLALVMSSVAVAWNMGFNALFERWEARQASRRRTFGRRLLHGLGFEGGLVVMLVPLMAWWLETTLLAAFLADLVVLVFFFVYAVGFTWCFDRVFGLPASAREADAHRPA